MFFYIDIIPDFIPNTHPLPMCDSFKISHNMGSENLKAQHKITSVVFAVGKNTQSPDCGKMGRIFFSGVLDKCLLFCALIRVKRCFRLV